MVFNWGIFFFRLFIIDLMFNLKSGIIIRFILCIIENFKCWIKEIVLQLKKYKEIKKRVKFELFFQI